MEEYVSWEVVNKIFYNGDKLSYYCHTLLHRPPTKFWYYPTTYSGAHPSAPKLENYNDINYLIDENEQYGSILCSFNWKELFDLMNVCVIGDYRKTEFECIENIDEFAIELNQYLKEKADIETQDYLDELERKRNAQ